MTTKGWLENLSPAARARNADLLEPRVAENLTKRKRGTPENDLQAEVISDLEALGYKAAFFRPAKVLRGGVEKYETPIGADGKGWPDVVAVHPVTGACFVFELKAANGTVADAQLAWLRAWRQVPGVTVMVIRPETWEEQRALL